MILSHSRIQTKQRCDALYDIHYNQGYRPVGTAPALRFGSLFHVGLEAWWKAVRALQLNPEQDPAQRVLHRSVDAVEQSAREKNAPPIELVRARALLVAYHERWIGDMAAFGDGEGYRVIGVETEFTVSIGVLKGGREVKLRGIIDAAVVSPDRRLLIVEHKTSSEDISPASLYWRRIRLNSQIASYYLGGREVFGRPVDGCLYDVVGKPKLDPYAATPAEKRQYKCDGRCPKGKGLKCQGHTDGALYANQRERDESLGEFGTRLATHIADDRERYFQRQTEVRLADEVKAYADHVLDVAQQIAINDELDLHPKSPAHCFEYGRECDFYGVCCGENDLGNALLYRRGLTHAVATN